MAERTPAEPEDKLREEYFDLLPQITRLTQQLNAEIQFHTLAISHRLGNHEQLIVKTRVKGCASAIEKLRRKEEGGEFDRSNPARYSLTNLNDLAAVRILVFPRSLMEEVDAVLRAQFPSWLPDPIRNKETGALLAHKYFGFRPEVSDHIRGEYQIASMLTGLFWEVEHDALYKLEPRLKNSLGDRKMNDRTSAVYQALTDFEDEFERYLHRSASRLK